MNAVDILAKLRAGRELKVVVDHITFIGQCPLYSRLMRVMTDSFKDTDMAPDAVMASKCITNWEGVTEADILPGGDPTVVVPFDKALFEELVLDNKDWWIPISKAITSSVMDRQVKKEAEIKNSPATTTRKRSKGSRARAT